MLNPNEIANKRFDKVMGQKYRADDVDNYLAQVADSMNDLLEEKQELEKKLIVLADKLEEYKDDEESLRSALLGAQKLGDSVVRDAKAKARDILEDAEARANMIVENAKQEIERQQAGFVRMQREVATFKSKLQLVYKQHLELIASIPVDENIVNAAMKKHSPNRRRRRRPQGRTSRLTPCPSRQFRRMPAILRRICRRVRTAWPAFLWRRTVIRWRKMNCPL